MTKQLLHPNNFQSEALQTLSQKCLSQREMLMSEGQEINRIRNECFSLTSKLIKIQQEISDALKNQMFFLNPYILNKQVGLMKSSTSEPATSLMSKKDKKSSQ